jgi:signal transduction histidine kinase
MINRNFITGVPFSVDARIAIQLGRESISSSLIAIVELVKNAYDADATEVIVKFSNPNGENPRLIISDDGDGMTQEELVSKWMLIGTNHKTNKETSIQKKRVHTGAKGLGRLGIDRLCSKLDLFTSKNNTESIFQLEIEWNKYSTRESSALDSIKHDMFSIPRTGIDQISDDEDFAFLKTFNRGTIYSLSNLKDTWNADFLTELRDELALLVSPFSEDLGFRIRLETGIEGSPLNGYVTSGKLLEGAEWKLLSEINEKGEVTTLIYNRDNEIKYERNEIPWAGWIKDRKDLPSCGPLAFEVYFMRNTASSNIDTNKFEPEVIRNFLKNNQGIRIYRDHFRVKPYGNPNGDGDWLNLAFRRMTNPQGVKRKGWRIGYNQVVGAVFIGRDKNPNLVDQTNREGLTEVPAYYDLKAFASKAISVLENVIHEDAASEKPQGSDSGSLSEVVSKSIESYTRLIGEVKSIREKSSDKSTIKALEAIESKLSEESLRSDSFKEKIQRLEEEKDTMANLASIGILAASFSHEIIGATSLVESNCDLANGDLDGDLLITPTERDNNIRSRIRIIENSISYINSFASFTIANIKKNKRIKQPMDLAEISSNVFSKLGNMLAARNIKVEIINNLHERQFVNAYPIDWESIFANLVTNSCWALENTPGDMRHIKMTLSKSGEVVQIDFEDSGKGVEAGTEDFIFNATYSTKRDLKGSLNGTGMGLAIIKTFVEEHSQGTAKYVGASTLGGAHFRLLAPIMEAGT